MGRWNAATNFEFRIRRETFESPCDGLPTRTSEGDFENGVGFVSDVCGDAFGENVLGVCTWWHNQGITIQSNIHFNSAYSWNVYDDPHNSGKWKGVMDFRRVAVHELGHAIGLGHEDDVPAVMATFQRVGNTIVAPQADDIAGVAELYGRTEPPPGETRPPNDLFSNALTISGSSGRTTGSNVGATVETGEPGDGASSVWWQWRPTSSGTATFDTVASSFDTTLGVYTGTRVNALRRLAENDDAVGLQSRVILDVTAGTVYRLRVAGFSDSGGTARGNIVLNWNLETESPPGETRPPNDLFSNALTISRSSGRTMGSNVGATVETGEPGDGASSVWWQWRPTSSGTATFDTVASSFDTTLGVYTGTRVNALRKLAENDDAVGLQSRVILDVTAGTVYRLRVAGFSDSSGTARGNIVLNWNLETEAPPLPPNNDSALMIFPQVADGSLSDGAYYRTTILLTRESSGDATCRVKLYGMNANFEGLGRSSLVTLTVPGDSFVSVRTTGTGRIQTGYATVDCDTLVSGQLTYSSYDKFGTKLAEATVFPTEIESSNYSIIVDGRDGAQLALAIANNTDHPEIYSLYLQDSEGRLVGEGYVAVAAHSNLARFVNELISPPPLSGIVYLLEVQSATDSGFSMIGLRFTGYVFSTVPTN